MKQIGEKRENGWDGKKGTGNSHFRGFSQISSHHIEPGQVIYKSRNWIYLLDSHYSHN